MYGAKTVQPNALAKLIVSVDSTVVTEEPEEPTTTGESSETQA